jgi:putative transposase
MKKPFQRLLISLASSTDRELARQVRYLKEENKVLRSKLPKRNTVTPEEKHRLVKFGKPVGKAIKELVTIVRHR